MRLLVAVLSLLSASCAGPRVACALLRGEPVRYIVQRSTEIDDDDVRLVEAGLGPTFERVNHDADVRVILTRHPISLCSGARGCLISPADGGCLRDMVMWLDLTLPDDELTATAQHEAGHVLGLREIDLRQHEG